MGKHRVTAVEFHELCELNYGAVDGVVELAELLYQLLRAALGGLLCLEVAEVCGGHMQTVDDPADIQCDVPGLLAVSRPIHHVLVAVQDKLMLLNSAHY
jgi:hypothetical protein